MERYILARLLVFGFLLFVVIFFIIRIAGGGDDTVEPDFAAQETVSLGELATARTSSVQFIKDGKINSVEEHRQIRFTISANRRVVEILAGYNGDVIKKITLTNTQEAYEQFLYALENEGFADARENPTTTDIRGVCSSGKRYTYKVRLGASTRQELWSTTCRGSQGTFAGDRSDIVRLFERQFPEYDEFERGTVL